MKIVPNLGIRHGGKRRKNRMESVVLCHCVYVHFSANQHSICHFDLSFHSNTQRYIHCVFVGPIKCLVFYFWFGSFLLWGGEGKMNDFIGWKPQWINFVLKQNCRCFPFIHRFMVLIIICYTKKRKCPDKVFHRFYWSTKQANVNQTKRWRTFAFHSLFICRTINDSHLMDSNQRENWIVIMTCVYLI